MFNSAAQSIGIALDESGVRFVKLKKRKKWEVERSGYLPLPPGMFNDDQIVDKEQLQELLAKWVKSQKLKGNSVTISIPSSKIIIRRLTIPSVNAKEISQLVRLEVETTLHLPFEDPVFDYVTIDKDDTGSHILVFAASRQIVQAYIHLMEGAGLKVKGVELTATALARAITTVQKEPLRETMLVNREASNLEIHMFHEGMPVFVRAIPLNDLTDEDEQGLNAGKLAEIMAEISRMLNFYQFSIYDGNSRIQRALITGIEEGSLQLLAELQQAQSEIDIQLVDFGEYFSNSAASEVAASAMAIGLAIPQTEPEKLNLLPGHDREAKLLPLILASAVFVWILGMAAAGYTYFDNKSTLADQKESIQSGNEQLSSLENKLIARNQQAQSSVRSNPIEVISEVQKHRKDAVAIMEELSNKLPEGSDIETLHYSQSDQITLTVSVSRVEDASRYLFSLRSMSFASGAQLQSLTKETIGLLVSNSDDGGTSAIAPSTARLPGIVKQTAIYSVQFKKTEAEVNGNHS
ncbi:hypothetical protein D7Z26_04290 [Cohnella endophytica]|uniref:Uncharacterized protein n=1 Tax=Cohnella endophytica TaxID=2419778 RepID=A0A494Y3G8_9BACL|nr:pilus assembly protein PilM [Cohnella endophytica]RKP57209.1 hypothetical protein D7Z26_04290 [Cohnella endophytica]